MSKLNLKRCTACGEEFEKRKMGQKVCGLPCAIKQGRVDRERKRLKESRAANKRRKEQLKTLSDHKKDTQAVFNKYIRLRDKDKPCISCGKSPYQGQRHASHYRSRGAASQLAYNFLNVWASCSTCNNIHSGNLLEYRIALIKKIGLERVEALEHNNDRAVYDVDYLKRLQKILKRRIKHYSRNL